MSRKFWVEVLTQLNPGGPEHWVVYSVEWARASAVEHQQQLEYGKGWVARVVGPI